MPEPSFAQAKRIRPADSFKPSPLDAHTSGAVTSDGQAGLGWLLFSNQGRIGRLKYLLAIICISLINLALSLGLQLATVGRIVTFDPYDPQYIQGAIISLVVSLIFFWPNLALGIKRFHDQDRSGHWNWLIFIPLGVIPWIIMLLAVPGSEGSNRFGAPPT
jgi:uncharacterized membrane protein YhaH (DUF805 family)